MITACIASAIVSLDWHAGSAAGGVAELDSMRFNSEGKSIARAVEAGAEKVGEELANDQEGE